MHTHILCGKTINENMRFLSIISRNVKIISDLNIDFLKFIQDKYNLVCKEVEY